MKLFLFLIISLISLHGVPAVAGWQVPTGTPGPGKHFHPGHVLLSDSTMLTGYIRDYIRPNASIVFLDPKTGRKRSLNGAQIISVEIDTVRFLCVNGDFFRVVAPAIGQTSLTDVGHNSSSLLFLQKSSDASGKPVYNGTQPIMINGTEGRLNDYFLYDLSDHNLQLVNNKTMDRVIPTAFFKQQ